MAFIPADKAVIPGSPYYDDFIDNWAAGKYYPLWVMKEEDAGDKRVVGKINLSPAKN